MKVAVPQNTMRTKDPAYDRVTRSSYEKYVLAPFKFSKPDEIEQEQNLAIS